MTNPPAIDIVHNARESRFEARLPDGLCRADYRRVGNTLHMVHTEVPSSARGRGIAGRVVAAAADYAEAEGLKLMPLCSYVRAWFSRHPERQSLLAPGSRT
ncbi:MAG: GNAT family N-acetyltransferase [Burkholderiales bacterium]